MRPYFALIVLVAAALTVPLATPPAAAQEASSPVNATADDNCPDPEAIDRVTTLCDTDLEDDNAHLTFHSEVNQSVTLSDAGAFLEGGEVRQRTVELTAGETTTVRFPVTTVRGESGVSIDTTRSLYAVPLSQSRTLLGGPWTAEDAQAAGAGAALSVSVVVIALVIRRKRGADQEVVRLP